jgi:aerobic carbon-monoxide dehydrogenase large subunit
MSPAFAKGEWTGRVEDDALLRGQGRFGDDVKPDGALAACFVRSPHGFAAIDAIDAAAAKDAPGVVAVMTAADLAAAHYHSISHGHDIPGRGGKMPFSPHRPALADKRVSASRWRWCWPTPPRTRRMQPTKLRSTIRRSMR